MAGCTFRSGILSILLLNWISFVAGQDKAPESVWDGIYSNEQAARGKTLYTQACASCHGERLEGRGQTPPLAGDDFTSNWKGMTVGDLLDKMQVSMPADKPGKLSREQNSDILAYILKINEFPTGAKDLPAISVLRNVRFDEKRSGK
jgi:quinoprotein glucose dehydrogenase